MMASDYIAALLARSSNILSWKKQGRLSPVRTHATSYTMVKKRTSPAFLFKSEGNDSPRAFDLGSGFAVYARRGPAADSRELIFSYMAVISAR